MKNEFDAKAATWDEDPSRIKRAEVIAEAIKSKVDFQKIQRALEYGSGTGLLSFALHSELNSVVLMDDSAEMTKIASKKAKAHGYDHFKAIKYDLIKDKLPKEKFDFIYILLTLHHIINYEVLLDKLSQILRPGGRLAIIDLEKEDGSFHDGEFFGHKGFDKCLLKADLEEVGLVPKSYEVCYELEKTMADGSVRKYPLFMMISEKTG